MGALCWTGDGVVAKGVEERRFSVSCDGRDVPGMLWTPEGATGERPLVLLGHGGSQHKASPYVVAIARRLARHSGFAAAVIDGPVHAARRSDGGADADAVHRDFPRVRAEDPRVGP